MLQRPTSPLSASLLAAGLVLAACGGDDGAESDPIALEDRTDENAVDGGDDAVDGTTGDGTGDSGDAGQPSGDEVDGTTAEPGTWRVGDAGTVTFSVSEGALVLDEVRPADGWEVTEQEAEGDEIDVDLERADESYEFHVELEDDGSRLEVTIDHDLDDAGAGTFEIGDAGSVTVSIEGDRLVLDDLSAADGWESTEREVDDDEVSFTLARGDQLWEVEIELDDGQLDVDRDLSVRSTL